MVTRRVCAGDWKVGFPDGLGLLVKREGMTNIISQPRFPVSILGFGV